MKTDHQPSTASAVARISCRWHTLAALMVRAGCTLGTSAILCLLLSGSPSAAQPQTPPPPAPELRLLPRQTTGDSFLYEKLAQTGDLTLRKTSLPEALFAIGELWGLNLVVGEEVQGQVNCDFKEAPLSEILNTVLLSNGYSYRPFGRSLVIVRLADMGDINPLFETATIPIRFGDPTELVEGASVFNSPKGKTKAIPTAQCLLVVDYPDRVAMIREFVQGINASGASAGNGPGAGELQTIQFQPQFVPALMLKDAIGAALSKEGKVIPIEGENRLVVVDTPYYLRLAQQVMAQVDRPRSQVRITAYIYDVGLQDFETLGLNLANALQGRISADGTPQSSWAIDTITKVPFDGGAVSGAMTFFNMSDNFDLRATINALSTCKDSRLLADPNVVVVDNENASVAIISEIPFQQLTQTGQGGNIGTTAFREAGVKLNVLPRIAEDGTIQMLVEPEFSRLTGFTPESKQPIIDRRTAKTTVRVANGQTVVIGGLRQRTDVGTFNGIPFLKDIPYMGILFRSRETDVRESELIVFLKPEIVGYAEMLRCREAAALGTSHKYLDQIPIGETPVVPLPRVPSAPAEGQPQWEEIPAPPPESSQLPKSVEESSPGLALASQRGNRNHNLGTRPTVGQSTANSSVQQKPPTKTNTTVSAYRRLPPVQSVPAIVAEPVAPSTGFAAQGFAPQPGREPVRGELSPRTAAPSGAVRYQQAPPERYQQPRYQQSPAAAVNAQDVQTNQSSAPAAYLREQQVALDYAPATDPVVTSLVPRVESVTSPRYAAPYEPVQQKEEGLSLPAPVVTPENNTPEAIQQESGNPLRTRGYRLNDSDEVRSASWINNVFRY